MRLCDACGSDKAYVLLGGTSLCKTCSADVEMEIARLREEGKPVNAVHIARRMYREKNDPRLLQVKDVPEEMIKQIKQRALDDSTDMRGVVLTALAKYLK